MKKIISAILAVMIVMTMCIIPSMAEEENLALGKTVTVGADVTGAIPELDNAFFRASNITDGGVPVWDGVDQTCPLGWYSAFPAANGDVGNVLAVIDLEEMYNLGTVKVYPMQFLDGQNMPQAFDVIVSKDCENWTTIGTETDVTGAHSYLEPFVYQTTEEARYVAIFIHKMSAAVKDENWIYSGIGEVEVFAAEAKTFCASLDAISGLKEKSAADVYSPITAVSEIEAGTEVGLLGWVLTKTGVEELQYSIDGGEWKPLEGQYRARADVHNAFPGWDEALNPVPGFGLDGEHIKIPDTKDLAIGNYVIKVRAVDSKGNGTEFLTINLTVAGEIFIPDPTNVALDENAEKFGFTGAHGGTPDNFKGRNETGVKFTVPAGKAATQFVAANSPTWGNAEGTGSDVLATVYAWNTDYATSVAGEKVAETQIYGHKDNADLIVDFGKEIPAGEYIIVFKANGANNIGSWSGEKVDGFGPTAYFNGVENEYIPAAYIMVVDKGEAPVTEGPKATDLHGASFDTIYVNDTMNFGEGDGSASTKLDGQGRKIDGSDGSVTEIRVRGWIGFEQEIAQFGYKIGNSKPVFGDFAIAPEAAVVDPANGGQYASRFEIKIPVAELKGTNKIVAVVKLADGTVIAIDENVSANGAGTTPNTSFTYVGPAAPAPQTGDAPVMAIAAVAVVALAAVLVIRRKVTE